MKTILTITTLLAMLASGAQAQKPTPTPPKPVPPITTPNPGMKWRVAVADAASPDKVEEILTGERGRRLGITRLNRGRGNVSVWYHIGNRGFAWNKDEDAMVEFQYDDSEHNSALSYLVRGIPGIHWVNESHLENVVMNPDSNRWIAIYQQEAMPMKRVGDDDKYSYLVATGPTVDVTATFDALTGLPLRAEVGDKVYTYQIRLKGGTDPEIPPALRAGIEKKLQREAALAEAIRQQEGGQ